MAWMICVPLVIVSSIYIKNGLSDLSAASAINATDFESIVGGCVVVNATYLGEPVGSDDNGDWHLCSDAESSLRCDGCRDSWSYYFTTPAGATLTSEVMEQTYRKAKETDSCMATVDDYSEEFLRQEAMAWNELRAGANVSCWQPVSGAENVSVYAAENIFACGNPGCIKLKDPEVDIHEAKHAAVLKWVSGLFGLIIGLCGLGVPKLLACCECECGGGAAEQSTKRERAETNVVVSAPAQTVVGVTEVEFETKSETGMHPEMVTATGSAGDTARHDKTYGQHTASDAQNEAALLSALSQLDAGGGELTVEAPRHEMKSDARPASPRRGPSCAALSRARKARQAPTSSQSSRVESDRV